MQALLIIGAIVFLGWLVVVAAPVTVPLLIVALTIFLGFKLFEFCYYKGNKFNAIKDRISKYVNDCNEFNDHIESLKNVDIGSAERQYGSSDYHDASSWNFKREELQKISSGEHVYDCSRAVCANSRKQPLKYVCKYFNIKENEENLDSFEEILNNFEAAQEGKKLIAGERDQIVASVSSDIPFLIRKLSKKLPTKLGLKKIDLSDSYFPKYKFRYVSSGGNASMENVVTMDIANLNEMVEYINSRIKWKQSVAGQRALMTSALRKHILQRDDYTCRQCQANIVAEPHLLLEIDHIVPVSKGGLTAENNLQALCWRCNRSKGSKLINQAQA